MTDTHTHLYLEDFDADGGGAAAVRRALAAGVDRLVFPNVDAATLAPMEKLASDFPGNITLALGLHPTELTANWREEIKPIEEAMTHLKPVAIGEVGMDLYWDKTWASAQAEAFDHQLHWGEKLGLPVIVHCREALTETLDVLRNFSGSLPELIFHCFTGSPDDVRRIREVADVWFGIGGVATFKNARQLHAAIPEIGAQRILLETDSPYMAPTPLRGRRNESAFLPHVCNAVASLLNMTPDELEKATDKNAEKLDLCFH